MLLREAIELLSPHLDNPAMKTLLLNNNRLELLRQNIKKSIRRINFNKHIGKGPIKLSPETEKACKEFVQLCERAS